MTTELTKQEPRPAESQDRPRRNGELGSLDVWAHAAPIRLAGYEDDLAEPHILPGID